MDTTIRMGMIMSMMNILITILINTRRSIIMSINTKRKREKSISMSQRRIRMN